MENNEVIVNVIDVDENEAKAYVDYAVKKYGNNLKEVTIRPDPEDSEYVTINCKFAKPFERIRRITGYLVGTMDRWGDAKRSEEHDRVKHG